MIIYMMFHYKFIVDFARSKQILWVWLFSFWSRFFAHKCFILACQERSWLLVVSCHKHTSLCSVKFPEASLMKLTLIVLSWP